MHDVMTIEIARCMVKAIEKCLRDQRYKNLIRRIRDEKTLIVGYVETNGHQVRNIAIISLKNMKIKGN
jgi:hypothetical protein